MTNYFLLVILSKMNDSFESLFIFVNICKKFHPGWRGNFVDKTISCLRFRFQKDISRMNGLGKFGIFRLICRLLVITPFRWAENEIRSNNPFHCTLFWKKYNDTFDFATICILPSVKSFMKSWANFLHFWSSIFHLQ